MSNALLRVETAEGAVWFDSDPDQAAVGPERVHRRDGRIVAELQTPLEQAVAAARPAAEAVLQTFTALAPNEVAVEFGLRIDAEAGAVIAKTGIEAHFTVQLKWTAAPAPESE